MTSGPHVSVVMATCNGERYLRQAVESVLDQEDVDLELVVVDDGSTDGTAGLLEAFCTADSRVVVHRQENAGLTRALALGCAAARAPLIARQDDDDVSLPGRLRKLADALDDHPGASVVASWVESIGPADEPLFRTEFPEGLEAGTHAVLSAGRSPFHPSVMFRKADYEAVGGYRPEFYYAQDADLWYRLADRGGFLFLPDVLFRFRISESSISARNRESQQRLMALAMACREARAAGRSEEPLLREAAEIRPGRAPAGRSNRGAGAYFIGRALLRNRDPRALGYLRRYASIRPLDPKGWVSLLQARALGRGRG